MKLFCANCGLPLHLYRKAVKELGIIVDVVDYHECLDEPVPFDLSTVPGPFIPVEGKDKFVLGLNDLANKHSQSASKSLFKGIGTDDLRDRRFDNEKGLKSSAPPTVLDQIKSMTNSIPVHDNAEPESED